MNLKIAATTMPIISPHRTRTGNTTATIIKIMERINNFPSILICLVQEAELIIKLPILHPINSENPISKVLWINKQLISTVVQEIAIIIIMIKWKVMLAIQCL